MHVIWIVFLFALGACVGSFLNVVIYRLPRGESIVFPPSHCPACGHGIRWHDNIPLLSWLLLHGRCRYCKGPISPRYLVIEAITAVLVAGLYTWYFVALMRVGAGLFQNSWPMLAAHAALLCGLLACSVIDIQSWIVPLEACWFVSIVGLLCATASPPSTSFLPRVSPTAGAMSIAAAAGLAIAIFLLRRGLIQPSFLDADDKAVTRQKPAPPPPKPPNAQARKKGSAKARRGHKARKKAGKSPPAPKPAARIVAAAVTKAHGVNPRREVLREVLFLAPALVLAVAAWVLVTQVPAVAAAWRRMNALAETGGFARHFRAFQASLFGYLIGGLWIWGLRILGTLGFGKEAMGMGDVHILAAVGAVAGWIVPSVAFFVAPVFGVLWAIYLWLSRNQRELPYGPWLAVATLAVLLFYDPIVVLLRPYGAVVQLLLR